MHGGDGCLDRVRSGRPPRQRAADETGTFRDLFPVPQAAILLVEQDHVAGRRGPGRAPRVLEQHQRQEAQRFGLWQQIDEQPSQPDGFGGQIVSGQAGAGRGRVAFVEHEVDDPQDGVEPFRQVCRGWHLIGNARVADLRLRADDALRQRRGRREEGPCDFLGGEAAHFAQRERNLCVRSQRGMAAGEDQPEPVVLDALPVGPRVRILDGQVGLAAFLIERVESRPPAHRVDGLEPARRHEPGARVARHAVAGPLLERGAKGVVHGLLGGIEIAEQANQRREDAPGFRFVDGTDRLVDAIACRHGDRSHHLQDAGASKLGNGAAT